MLRVGLCVSGCAQAWTPGIAAGQAPAPCSTPRVSSRMRCHYFASQEGNNSVLAIRSGDDLVEVFDNWGGAPGAKLVADGGQPVTRENRLLSWAGEMEAQLVSQRQDLRRAHMELAAAREEAREARLEAQQLRSMLAAANEVRGAAQGQLLLPHSVLVWSSTCVAGCSSLGHSGGASARRAPATISYRPIDSTPMRHSRLPGRCAQLADPRQSCDSHPGLQEAREAKLEGQQLRSQLAAAQMERAETLSMLTHARALNSALQTQVGGCRAAKLRWKGYIYAIKSLPPGGAVKCPGWRVLGAWKRPSSAWCGKPTPSVPRRPAFCRPPRSWRTPPQPSKRR